MLGSPVTFVQPPASYKHQNPCLDDKQFGLGILANAAWLENNGFNTSGVHIPLTLHHGFSPDDAINLIIGSRPLLVAIGLNWVHFSEGAIETARRIKERQSDCTIIIGGQHASLFAEEIANHYQDCVDGVIIGEAEIPLLEICRSLRDSGKLPSNLNGLVRNNAQATPPQVVEPIDSLPVYHYSHLRPRPLQPDVAAVSTTRGACPFNCSWCIEPVIGRLQGRNKLQFHSASRITDQIAVLLTEGINRFTIQDNFFIGGDKKLIELAETLIKREVRPAHLNIFAHPESYQGEGLEALASCCDRASIDYGVETGSKKVAALNNRRLEPDDVVERIGAASSSSVEPYTWWMVGLPGEDDEALSETETLIKRTMQAGGVPRWVSPMILFPKTPIHMKPEQFGVKPEFQRFSDYAVFSKTTLAEALLFSDTVTHKIDRSSRKDITSASSRLRRFIVDNLEITEAFYADHSLNPDIGSVKQRITQSFF
ncbi:MAG: B12-binding domain-containing radical SAM protein [Candidatus Thiodiazotropha endolucinida]|uniref:B12-binding domain-containing radical SAM protein n=1 Tax=Candidatus Thiodiazotropha taylori TaxID=2792791 RepID=A0A9E4TT82_9GAMM|nr:B12-binding domain-containing radical SAM protein [Candidatus Thiodiazotropha taylori]MCW4236547.1 B12-binding domain-containing radical SAM protein [Candidatus Thiodiazotropha endolucinida]